MAAWFRGMGGTGGVGGVGGAGGVGGGAPNDLLENQVAIETSQGRFVIELNFEAAPITSSKFHQLC